MTSKTETPQSEERKITWFANKIWNETLRKRNRVKLLQEINSNFGSTMNPDKDDILDIGKFEHIFLFFFLNLTGYSIYATRNITNRLLRLSIIGFSMSFTSLVMLLYSEDIVFSQALRKEKNFASLYSRTLLLKEETEKEYHEDMRKANQEVIRKYFEM